MSGVSDIERARQVKVDAERQLRRAVVEAVGDGIPIAKAARAADITRSTVYRWIEEGKAE